MTMKELIDVMIFPPVLKDVALLAVILSLVEISPLKLNPWKWIKDFVELPSKIVALETGVSSKIMALEKMFERDKAHRWRTQILHHADAVRRGQKFSKETWDDVIDSCDRYNVYCGLDPDFKNGKTAAAMAFLNRAYARALEDPYGFLD